jgi:hypothetical protein
LDGIGDASSALKFYRIAVVILSILAERSGVRMISPAGRSRSNARLSMPSERMPARKTRFRWSGWNNKRACDLRKMMKSVGPMPIAKPATGVYRLMASGIIAALGEWPRSRSPSPETCASRAAPALGIAGVVGLASRTNRERGCDETATCIEAAA